MQEKPSVIDLINKIPAYLQESRQINLAGLSDSQLYTFLSCLFQVWSDFRARFGFGRILIVHHDSKYLQNLETMLQINSETNHPIIKILPRNFWGVNRYVAQDQLQMERLRAQTHLVTNKACFFFGTPSGLLQKTSRRESFFSSLIILRKDLEFDPDRLISALDELGYQRVNQTEEPGQYTIKGGVLDVFSPDNEFPSRCEFFNDRLIGLKAFNSETQISFEELRETYLTPIWEQVLKVEDRRKNGQLIYESLINQGVPVSDRNGIVDNFLAGHRIRELPMLMPILREGDAECILDYLNKEDVIVLLDGLKNCSEKHEIVLERFLQDSAEDVRAKRTSLAPDIHFFEGKDFENKIRKHGYCLTFDSLQSEQSFLQISVAKGNSREFIFDSSLGLAAASGLGFWVEKIKDLATLGRGVLVLARQEEHLHRISSIFQHHGISHKASKQPFATSLLTFTGTSAVVIGIGHLPGVVWDEHLDLLVLPEHILFGEQQQQLRKQKAPKLHSVFRSFQDIEPGSLLVHTEHGIGRYQGMRTMEIGGIKTDFLMLEYADQDKLYVPVHRLNLLQKYANVSDSESHPLLDKLRSQAWASRKERAKKAIREMADQLLHIYAQRKLAKRTPYCEPGDEYFQFEADFIYAETPDQQRAIDEVNYDLSSDKPMDRLICGDVGFGKTEVALRAAMRVAFDGQQVLVLVPTTLLSMQHFETFSKRFRKYGIVVGLANRFVRINDIKKALEGFKAGSVDILIGTHRLLSKDVVPKRLGLLVIDEEQRFGVAQKEAIKNLKASCDVLALSATPIPRSLHMSLLGIRDVSIIQSPPSERLAIKTYILDFDEDLIRAAIMKEIERNGQVFFVHNRVQNILEIKSRLERIIPSVSIAVAHGQMRENDLESVVLEFLDGKFKVLICTAIVESGLDMPNVNTIIVNEADKFGLAQLYQLRGRVGRSSRQSYAYLIAKGEARHRDEARQRLEVLVNHQDLGVGFQIASYDMEMRGAGNLLGGDQSGRIGDVGYDLYMELLEKEINALNGSPEGMIVDPEIKISISASLPPDYISQEKIRIALYKRLFSAQKPQEVDEIRKETRDRFGAVPENAEAIFSIARLKSILRQNKVAQIQALEEASYELRFSGLREDEIMRITEHRRLHPKQMILTPDFRLIIKVNPDSPLVSQINDIIGCLLPLIYQC